MNIELSLGNLIVIGFGALLAIPTIVIGCRYLVHWNVPVVSQIASGITTVWSVAK